MKKQILTAVLSLVCGTTVYAAGENVDFYTYYQDNREYVQITAFDPTGNHLWVYNSEGYPASQLSAFSGIGMHNGLFYFAEYGHIYALDPNDGHVVWDNEGFFGSAAQHAFDFDENGSLYISGYYGPDLYVVSDTGATLYEVQDLEPGYFWPYQLNCLGNGKFSLTYEGDMDGGSEEELSVTYDVNALVSGIEDQTEDDSDENMDEDQDASAEDYSPNSTEEMIVLQVVNCNEFITLREEPSFESKVLIEIPLGEYMRFIDYEDDTFLQVEYQGKTGYAASAYIRFME